MFENHELNILNVGQIDFPLAWTDWSSITERVFKKTIKRHELEALGSDLKALRSYDCVRINHSQAQSAYSLFASASPLIVQTKFVDCIWQKNGIFWPHLVHKDAVHSLILARQPYLNIKGAGLIVGGGAEAILAAHVLVELGIKKLTFVIEEPEGHDDFHHKVKQNLFEIEIEVITSDKVILLPGNYSVMICYESLLDKPDLVTALLYFNYLERGGLVINFGADLAQVPLVEEATAIGAKVVDIAESRVFEEIMALRKVVPFNHEQMLLLLKSFSF